MGIPISSFWLLNENIGRIRAEESLREMANFGNAQSKDGGRSYQKTLVLEMGKVAIENPILAAKADDGAFDKLRKIASVGKQKQ